MSQKLQGQIRTLLVFIGGLAVQKGWIDEQTMITIVGGIVALSVAIWSWKSKDTKPAVTLPRK